jgi:hypothetical protein
MMQLKYLAHSSFLITCGTVRLLFDPWLNGSTYFNQWFLWPLPKYETGDLEVDAVLISHGHEDHLHTKTLREIPKSSELFFPFQWRAGIRPFLNNLGFKKVREAVSFRTYHVKDVKVTYVGFSLESVVVIEYKDEVLVNINDALNSNHENAVNFLLGEIKKRWPKITFLLSGWSGASYFPNQIRYPAKNDIETAKLREQYFANNFCRFVRELQPKCGVPFASGFVLLNEENKWINLVKFPRSRVASYYHEHFSDGKDQQFLVPYPGDLICNFKMEVHSTLHGISEPEQYEMAYRHYYNEIKEVNKVEIFERDKLSALLSTMNYWINFNKRLYHPRVIQDAFFSVHLTDCAEVTFINIGYDRGELIAEICNRPFEGRRVLISTTAKKLAYAYTKVWGGDILTIGYGLTAEVYDQLSLEKNLDIVCIRLITRYPIARQDLMKFPGRAIKFYTQNPRLTSLWLKQKIQLKPYVNKYPYNERDHWMLYNKCALCAVCKMPEINLDAY